jgi:hypothetical protein
MAVMIWRVTHSSRLGPGEAAVAGQEQVEGLDVTLVEAAHQCLVGGDG